MPEQNSGIIVVATLAAAALGVLAVFAWQGQPDASAQGAASRDAAGEEQEAAEPAGEGEPGGELPQEQTNSFQTISLGAVRIMYDADTFNLARSGEGMPRDVSVPPCSGGFHYCFYAKLTFAQTNFQSAGVRVNNRTDLRPENKCLRGQPSGFKGRTPSVRVGERYATSVFPDIGSVAAGSYTTGSLYRVYADGECYELETRIAESSYPNYVPGSIRRFTDQQRNAVQGELDDILSGVLLRDGTPVLFP